MQIGENTTFSVGGEYRARFHNEGSMRGSQGRVNNFLLHRTRLYGDLKFADFGRVFVEGIDAQSNYEVLPTRGIDENRYDFLNAFADLRVLNTDRGTLTARYGRQELLYGAQRTVSPLDWANIRRTFEGYKAMWKGEDWNTDFFYVNPLNKRTNAIDTRNENVELMGGYASYKGIPDWAVDFYYLGFNNSVANFSYDTYGTRAQGKAGGLLYDFEGAYQGGSDAAGTHDAGFFTLGVGKKFADAPWSPTFFAYYDWASGANGNSQGYHHIPPLAHKYTGFMDFFGRRNIEDFNFQCVMTPAKKFKLLAWFHIFNRVETTDTPYNVAMAPFGTAAGGKQLGQELDMVLSYKISPRSDIALGYSHFFSGAYFDANPGIPFSSDADFTYMQYSMKF